MNTVSVPVKEPVRPAAVAKSNPTNAPAAPSAAVVPTLCVRRLLAIPASTLPAILAGGGDDIDTSIDPVALHYTFSFSSGGGVGPVNSGSLMGFLCLMQKAGMRTKPSFS